MAQRMPLRPKLSGTVIAVGAALLLAGGLTVLGQSEVRADERQWTRSSLGLGERELPIATRTWRAGERIRDTDLTFFDDNADRMLDQRDRMYRTRLTVRGGPIVPEHARDLGHPRLRLTPRGPEVRRWLRTLPVEVYARRDFGIAKSAPRP